MARAIVQAGTSQGMGNLRMSRSEAYFTGLAAAVLLDNALAHAKSSPCAPFICCALEAGGRDVNLAVLDLGGGVAGCADPGKALRDCLAQSSATKGGLISLSAEARSRGIGLSVEIRTGTASARWRNGWERREVVFGPGWVTGLTVHRDQRG